MFHLFCEAAVSFEEARNETFAFIEQRTGGMVMQFIDDIVEPIL